LKSNPGIGLFFYVYIDGNGYPISQTHGGELVIEGDSHDWITIDVYVDNFCIGSGSISITDLVGAR